MRGRPLSPSEVEDSGDETGLSRAIDHVNRGLKEGRRTFARSLFTEMTLPGVMREFQAAGWDVQLVYDWRDGDYLEFKRRKP